MRIKHHSRKLTTRQQERKVFRPDALNGKRIPWTKWAQDDTGFATIRCAFCDQWTDLTRGIDGRIDMLSGSNVEVPSSQFDYTSSPDTLTQATETRGLPRQVRGWLCPDCANDPTLHATDLTPRKQSPTWRIGPSTFHNTPVQRRAAAKLQDYLDYCDVAGVEPSPDMVWAITAVLVARRSYGFVKVRETLTASAGWAHTGQPWQSWHQSAMCSRASVVDVLDGRKTRGKQSLTAYRPDDYYVTWSDIIDAALADARRIDLSDFPREHFAVVREPFRWYRSGRLPSFTWAYGADVDTRVDLALVLQRALVDTLSDRIAADCGGASVRPYSAPTFGESSRERASGAVCMAYRPGEAPEPLPVGGCRHGLRRASWCVTCAELAR